MAAHAIDLEGEMLWDASVLKGYGIDAEDGRLGTVSDFLFEDTSWTIRWLVVDTGNWLSGRSVLLPPSVLGQPDAARRQFPVTLTMQQVKDSPEFDTDLPVSRQMEARVYDHYGWDPYWGAGYMIDDAMAMPFGAPLRLPGPMPEASVVATPPSRKGDPHLRSIAAIIGYHIHASDGELGHVQDLLVDDDNWSIRYIKVDTGNWLAGKIVLIAPRSVQEIDWALRLARLAVDRGRVKSSPPYDPSMTVDGAYEQKFRAHYNLPEPWP
jgi:sporulation protein YlmC with PRC-barrel domain